MIISKLRIHVTIIDHVVKHDTRRGAELVQLDTESCSLGFDELFERNSTFEEHEGLINTEILLWIVHFLASAEHEVGESSDLV